MFNILNQKMKAWSLGKLEDHTQHVPLPDLPDRNRFIQEYDHNGLFVYNDTIGRFYGDDGTVIASNKNYDDNAWTIYEYLYNKVRMARPVRREIIDGLEFVEFRNPCVGTGIPFTAEVHNKTLNQKLFTDWIDLTTDIINALSYARLPFPHILLSNMKFVRDNIGLFFSPMIGAIEIIKFKVSKEEFIDEQIKRVNLTEFLLTEGMGMDGYDINTIDWKYIKQYARESWQPLKTLTLQ